MTRPRLAAALGIPAVLAGGALGVTFAPSAQADMPNISAANVEEARSAKLAAQLMKERAAHRSIVRHLRARLRVRAVSPSYATAMQLANVVYGVPVRGLSALTWCESRHTPGAQNPTALSGSRASGAAQILFNADGRRSSTWHTTPYAHLSPFDLTTNLLAAGYIWKRAGGSFREWADICARQGDGA